MTMTMSASEFLDHARAAGMAVLAVPRGGVQVICDDEDLLDMAQQVADRGVEISAEISRRLPSNEEFRRLRVVREQHRRH